MVADGPNFGSIEDKKKCDCVREMVSSPDWKCTFHKLFRETNYGCGKSVKEAIDWFFTMESEGIILEDDTVPSQSFFQFSKEILEKYRNDDRVGIISGLNPFMEIKKPTYKNYYKSSSLSNANLPDIMLDKSSYFFARNKTTWGWATWRRVWKYMDYKMTWLQAPDAHKIVRNMSHYDETLNEWMRVIDLIRNGKVNTWDWHFYFSLSAQNQLTIYPKKSLVSNIGVGENATHTYLSPRGNLLNRFEIKFPLIHPNLILADDQWDAYYEKQKFKNQFSLSKKILPKQLLGLWSTRK